ncbi:MAG: hypothetical protein IKI84_02620 [Clostridia bacterium]|nr:hypothetical protein [Clostridia bacterium]
MTTFQSYKKFGLEMRGAVGAILTIAGCALMLLGLAVAIVDRVTGKFGLEGEILLIFLLIFMGMGVALLFFGIRMFLKDKERVDGLREAYENDRCVMADIAGIVKGTSFKASSDNMFTGVRYRETYTVECHFRDPATGKPHICYSQALYCDPAGMITSKQVPVYIDRNNENNLYVDIDRVLAEEKQWSCEEKD